MTKIFGYGSVLTVTTTTAETDIGQIRNISGPGASFNDVDTTTLDSSSNYRTFTPGLGDPGEVTFSVIYDTTSAAATMMHVRLTQYMNARSAKTFKAYHGSSTGDVSTFSAYVKGMGREIPLDDVITCDFTLKVSGLPGYST
jgi:hypothetical protein